MGWGDADVFEIRGTGLLIATVVYVLWMLLNLSAAVVALLGAVSSARAGNFDFDHVVAGNDCIRSSAVE